MMWDQLRARLPGASRSLTGETKAQADGCPFPGEPPLTHSPSLRAWHTAPDHDMTADCGRFYLTFRSISVFPYRIIMHVDNMHPVLLLHTQPLLTIIAMFK